MPTIPQWSYSRLKTFEGCPKKAEYAYIQKIKEPGNKAMDRGKDIHKLCEEYIRGRYEEMPPALKEFEEAFDLLKDMHLKGHVLCEGDWAFTTEWTPTGWFDHDTWGRAKVDAFVHVEGDKNARVIDFKTGRYEGNQEGHREQCELYASIVFKRLPELETITTELWYLDHAKLDRYQYDKETVEAKRERLNARAVTMTTTEEFPAKPSQFKCKWCYFGKQNICPSRFD